jgi:outer membrane protein assembly factor BamB
MLMTRNRRYLLASTLLASLTLLTGCAGLDAGRDLISGLTEYVLGDDDNADPPATLAEDFQGEIQTEQLWQHSIGDGADGQFLKLIPAVRSDILFVGDRKGLLQARNSVNGESAWENKTSYNFSAGPGVGVHSIFMGTSHAEVIAFDKVTGEQKWNTRVPSEVLAVPVVARGMVFIRTTDGKIIALNEHNGSVVWTVEQSVPALSIRGTGNPLVIDDTLIAGAANGKLGAFQVSDGKALWEATIAMPAGRSEVERLVDLDADPVERRGAIFIASYQGGTSSVSETDGDVIWRNEAVSSYTGLSTDMRYIYISDTRGDVSQLDQRNGAALWKQKDLHNRRLTAAIAYDNYVVVGDFEGYVHWLSITDGRLMGRTRITKAPIENTPVVVDGTVYVYAKDGTLAALRVK